MDDELANEIDYEIQLLVKSGFYDNFEILEIIEEEFFEEDISLEEIELKIAEISNDLSFKENSSFFNNLKNAFSDLMKNKQILAIHNAGYDLEEGVQFSFELFTHIRNNKLDSKGFCFYAFEDVEIAIEEKYLSISFGDFENNKDMALAIGKSIVDTLNNFDFEIEWDETVNNPIVIKPFVWEKSFDDEEYSMEGAANDYLNLSNYDDE